MIYFLLLTIILIILSNSKVGRNSKLIYVPLLLMILLCGFRGYEVGTDTSSYLETYHIHDSDIFTNREPLYNLLMVICKKLSFGNTMFLLMTALLTYLPLFYAIKKWSVNRSFSLLIYVSYSVYFYCNSFNVIRNAIAASFLLIAFCYYNENNIKRTIIYILIAVGFHYSTIIVLPFLFIAHKIENVNYKYAIIALILSIPLGLSMNFTEYANQLNILLSAYSNIEKIQHYNTIYLNDLTNNEFNANGLFMQIAPITLCSIFSFLSNSANKYFRAIFFIGTIIGNFFVSVLFVYRITLFFNILAVLMLPSIISGERTKPLIKAAALTTTYLLVLFFIYNVLRESPALVIFPYKFA